MSAPILGTLAGKKTRTLDDFVPAFLASVTPAEWNILTQLPPMKRVEQLILTVIEIRRVPRYPLRKDHPLNPATRYEEEES